MKISNRQKVVEISFSVCYNTPIAQDSYIGNTTASQAVKAGSTPVSCSNGKDHPVGWSFILVKTREANPSNALCQWHNARGGLTGRPLLYSTPVSCSKISLIHTDLGGFLLESENRPLYKQAFLQGTVII